MTDIVHFHEVDQTQVAIVGGKGAAIAQLSRITGVRVPDGFCVTTFACQRFMSQVPSIDDLLERLSRLDAGDRDVIRAMSAEIRGAIQATDIADDLMTAVTGAVTALGERAACVVRSSATAEDLPTASFAGQHDSFLNVTGTSEILEHVRRCWASLFTERAVTYRLRGDIDHRRVGMAVVVQRLVCPEVSGVLFTADPLSGHRGIASIEACLGLGEALVSGAVSPDVHMVRDDEITTTIAVKPTAVLASPGGGTHTEAVDPERRERACLTEAQVRHLVQVGQRIEGHFGRPQDIEWCLAEGEVWIVQSRPITTLFPVPEVADAENHVYVSVGHQQMMTEAMRPLGLSVWLLTAMAPMQVAGGRLFVDVTRRLASPATREGLLELMRRGDPLIGDALQTIVERGDFLPPPPDTDSAGPAPLVVTEPSQIDTDPTIVDGLIERSRASIAALQRELQTQSGPALFGSLRDAFAEHRRSIGDPLSIQAIMAGMQATWWLNEHIETWLGDTSAADTLTLSAPGNVTAEMGLALLDVADAIRPHVQLVGFLRGVAAAMGEGDSFLDEIVALPGGAEAREAIRAYLERYGMRCVGEIDITRPRWSERPATLLPAILANVENFAPGEAERRRQRGLHDVAAKEREVLARLRTLPDGEQKARESERMMTRLRTFTGYREYPKYEIVSRYFIYKQALMREAEQLAAAGVLADREDIFFLTFQELSEVAATHRLDRDLIARRRAEFAMHQALTAPRVLTSDGEAIAGAYRDRELPAGALVGLPVCVGTVEGRARVIRDIAQADLGPDDILVTTFTDPSWTPLFLAIKGLVTEVGGLMTHGAVIAREYGLPAVVGVQRATDLIRDGQWIRLHATDGYVEILADPGDARSPERP